MLRNFLLMLSVFTHVASSFTNSLNKRKFVQQKVQLPQDSFEMQT